MIIEFILERAQRRHDGEPGLLAISSG